MGTRGKDAKPRYRRSALQLAVDKWRENHGYGSVDWASLTDEQRWAHTDAFQQKRYAEEVENLVTVGIPKEEPQETEEPRQEPQETAPVTALSVETLVVEQEESKAVAETLSQTAVVQKVTAKVLDTVFQELETRTQQILNAYKPRTVVLGIKVNEQPVKKLNPEPLPILPKVLGAVKAGLLPLLVGPAGCGKTLLAEQVAEALDLPFGHLCFSAGVSETWLFGRQTPNGFIEGEFSRRYREGGVFLADELDAADANLLLAINTALANGHLFNPISGEKVERHPEFYFIGTANTFGKGGNSVYTGRSRLDAATLDRFVVFQMDYLPEIEERICPDPEVLGLIRKLRAAVKKHESTEVVSYRATSKAVSLKGLGFTLKEIKEALTASWPEEIQREVA